MALIACPECEATISDKAPACPHCGAPAASESKLIVSGPMQTVIYMPKVRAYIGAREVAVIRQGDLVTIPIDHDCTVKFTMLTMSRSSASIHVKAGEVTRIQLAWSRLSGALIAQRVETIAPGSMF